MVYTIPLYQLLFINLIYLPIIYNYIFLTIKTINFYYIFYMEVIYDLNMYIDMSNTIYNTLQCTLYKPLQLYIAYYIGSKKWTIQYNSIIKYYYNALCIVDSWLILYYLCLRQYDISIYLCLKYLPYNLCAINLNSSYYAAISIVHQCTIYKF
jgi:hypothetical protein